MSSPELLTPDLVRRFTASHLAYWLFDWDGTLVDLAPRPDAIKVPPALLDHLRRLEKSHPGRVAVISGRSLDDLETWIPLPRLILVGNHGAEWRVEGQRRHAPQDPGAAAALDAVRTPLHDLARSLPGTALEDKGWTFSFHVRGLGAEERETCRTVIQAIVGPHPALCIRPADGCWEIRPVLGPTKGDAVKRLLSNAPASAVPCVFGDDWTDEDAFEAVGTGLTVVVGNRRPTRARYHLPTPRHVRALLQNLTAY
ncbi:MAG: trehalose-phosphatase [Thermaerobacter sp.]|nr:trehalose-phosphatase [Thermaerobacter sp.]